MHLTSLLSLLANMHLKYTNYFSFGNMSSTFKCATKRDKIPPGSAGLVWKWRKNQVMYEFMQHVYGGVESNKEHECSWKSLEVPTETVEDPDTQLQQVLHVRGLLCLLALLFSTSDCISKLITAAQNRPTPVPVSASASYVFFSTWGSRSDLYQVTQDTEDQLVSFFLLLLYLLDSRVDSSRWNPIF